MDVSLGQFDAYRTCLCTLLVARVSLLKESPILLGDLGRAAAVPELATNMPTGIANN